MAETKFFPPGKLADPRASWYERLLARFFWQEEITRADGDLYMRRFIIAGRNPYSRWFKKWTKNLYIHVFYRSDDDPDPHDHPADFRTTVLSWNGYTNEVWWSQGCTREVVGRRRMGFLSTAKHRAEHLHRVRLNNNNKRVVTLVVFGKKRRDWYFHTSTGPVYWETYLARPRAAA